VPSKTFAVFKQFQLNLDVFDFLMHPQKQ